MRMTSNPPSPRSRPSSARGISASSVGEIAPSTLASHMVDAVRAIPGRRFDWDAKEWWAPQADSTAPYVKGVIERYPSLLVAPEVTAWLAEATSGWVGRVGAARLSGRGAFVLETISGELPDELAPLAEEHGGRLW